MPLKAVALLVLIAGLSALPAPASAAPGDLDPGFGSGGIVTGSFGGNYSEIVPVLVLPDGRILAGGSGNAGREFALARFMADGKPDSTFGTGGVTATAIGDGGGRIAGIALQDDKIVAVGFTFFGSSPEITVARYSYDGVLDPTFQGGGYFRETPAVGNDATDVAIQADGKIVLAGGGDGFLVQRLLRDGGVDASFDGDSVAGVPGNVGECGSGSSSGAADLALSGGYIILSGTCGGRIVTDSQTSGLLRYNAGTTADGGALDTSFGSGGAATLRADAGKPTYSNDVGVQADGKFVQSVQTASGNAGAQVMLVRWNSDGSLDQSFGSGGRSPRFDFGGSDGSQATSTAIGADGFLFAGGSRSLDGGFGIGRLNPNGTLDAGFGSGGKSFTAVGDGVPAPMQTPSYPQNLAVQPDGKVIEAGFARSSGNVVFALTRWQGGVVPAPVPAASALGDLQIKSLRYKGKKVAATLLCRSSKVAACSGTIDLLAKAKAKRRASHSRRKKKKSKLVSVAKGNFSVAVGKTSKLSMKASARGRRLLRKKRKLAVTAKFLNATSGERRDLRSTIRKSAKKHKRKR